MGGDPHRDLVFAADPVDPLCRPYPRRRITIFELLTNMFGNTFKSASKQMLPVQVWVVILLITAVFFTVLGVIDLPNSHPIKFNYQKNYANFQVRIANLSTQLEEHCEEFHILTFGSSLLASAVARDTFFNSRFQQEGKPITVTRIFRPGAVYTTLEDSILISFLEKFQPDLICIEDQSFFLEPNEDLTWPGSPLSRLHRNYVFNVNTLKHLLLPQVFPEPGLNFQLDPTLTFDIDHAELDSIISQQDSIDYEVTMREVRNWSGTRRFNELVQTLEKQGTRLIVINIPRPEQIEKSYLSKPQIKKRDRLIRKYQKKTSFEYWDFGQAFPFRYYWDIRHVNRYGREIYSNWLFERIDQHYEERKSQ